VFKTSSVEDRKAANQNISVKKMDETINQLSEYLVINFVLIN